MRPTIEFNFNLNKAAGAMAYILSRTGRIAKIKLIKLLYLADRECFLQHGHPITGDRQCAMKYGPVPSGCLDAINGNTRSDLVFRFLHVEDDAVELRANASPAPKLPDAELRVLDEIIDQYGATDAWTLADQTHAFPEYREVYVEGTSTTIPYDLMLKHYGNQDQFTHNRPVITRQIAQHIVSPFPKSEPDL